MSLVRQARKASTAMQPPEPTRALMVCAFLAAVGVVSFFSQDVVQATKKVNGKSVLRPETVVHPATAETLVVLALLTAATVYWRKRYMTGICMMVCAAIGVGVPLPNGYSDLVWVSFLVPAGFVMWMLIFRMNKEQKEWLAKNGASANRSGSSAGSGGRRAQAQARQTGGTRSRKGADQPLVSATGRPLPANSGRYTQPRTKSRSAQRRS
jgi:hypothetical protein